MQAATHRRSKYVWFYKMGIGGKDMVDGRGWTLKTLNSWMDYFNECDVSQSLMGLEHEFIRV